MPWNNVTGETRRLYGGRHELAPRQKTFVKLRDLICRAISSLVFNISLSNLATLLISKRSFWPCWGIFANWSQYGTSLRKFDGQTLKKPWKGLFETGLFLVCNQVTGRSCWLTKQNKKNMLLFLAVEKRSLSYQRKWSRDVNWRIWYARPSLTRLTNLNSFKPELTLTNSLWLVSQARQD